MEKETTELSFVLKPAKYGVGVFASCAIKKGTHLRLFQNEAKIRRREKVPEVFLHYCVAKNKEEVYSPKDFGHMELGWYLNHSREPNAFCETDLDCFALRDIEQGEEILINYNDLQEPKEFQENYY